MSKLGIITALPDEAASLCQQPVRVSHPVEIAPDIVLCLSGMGYNNALNAAALLIKQGATALVSWGVAGALNEELHSGDLLIANKVISGDGEFDCSKAWQERLLVELSSDQLRVFNSSLYSTEKVCAKPADKQRLHEKTGADAVDMESAAIAELAHKMELDFVALRTIADEAVATIPAAVTRHTNSLGRPKPLRFALSCLFNPAQIPTILLLARAYSKAVVTLNEIAPDLKSQQFLYNTSA